MARPRTKPPALRRQSILDAARDNLIKNGYQDLNLDEVARGAGIAKGTLYLYFKDKNDLLASVFVGMLDRAERDFANPAVTNGSLDALRQLVVRGLNFMEETNYFLMSFSPGSVVLHGSGASVAKKRIERHLDLLAQRLKACMDAGVLRPCHPHDAALLLGSLMQTFLNRKFMRNSKSPLREEADKVLDFFLRGLGAP